MSDDIKPRIRVPAKAARGEVIEVKTLITHPMESGQRRDADGKLVPRKIVAGFAATYNGKPVIDLTMEPAISANPYLAFYLKVDEPGTLKLTWTDDDKKSWSTEAKIEIG
ncbi:MAG: thiosulfate oxidation carrier complex protein SoxZ [Alphaproteobacteria bacterium]|nr:thiosulfate oxidation carrier complex protein SoxZ [Alphaproteobacteria bacterium]